MTAHLYLKWTKKGRIPSYQGGKPIPVNQWTARRPDPELCHRGWHACRWEDAIHHVADELWICQLDGTIVEGNDKVAGERLKLIEQVTAIDDRSLRLFAADCAERVLPIFERERPGDDRPRKAIEAARQFANGEIDAAARAAAGDAAGDAAWAAARAAAWAAAGDAARATQTDDLLVKYAQLDPALFVHKGQP